MTCRLLEPPVQPLPRDLASLAGNRLMDASPVWVGTAGRFSVLYGTGCKFWYLAWTRGAPGLRATFTAWFQCNADMSDMRHGPNMGAILPHITPAEFCRIYTLVDQHTPKETDT